jgi:hypothetical protein
MQQRSTLLPGLEDARRRLQMLERASVAVGDVAFIAKCASRGTLADLQGALEEKVGHLESVK